MLWLIGAWVAPAIVWRATVQRHHLRAILRRRGLMLAVAFVTLDLIEHTALALQWTLLGAALANVAPLWLAGAVLGLTFATAHVIFAIDCLMHAASGYRIELMYVR